MLTETAGKNDCTHSLASQNATTLIGFRQTVRLSCKTAIEHFCRITISLCTFFTCRVRRFYACCPGNTLVFVTGGRPNTSRPVDATNRLILCQFPRPTTPPRKFAVGLSPSGEGELMYQDLSTRMCIQVVTTNFSFS